jgi:hypothetical protein
MEKICKKNNHIYLTSTKYRGCPHCREQYLSKWRQDNKDKIKESSIRSQRRNRDKVRERCRRWAASNKEKNSARKKEHYKNNKNKISERRKKLYEQNKELHSKRKKDWYWKNKEKSNQRSKEYRKENLDRLRQKDRDYTKSNLDKVNAKSAKRRASKHNATPNWLTADQLKDIQSYYSQAKNLEVLTGENYHVDHIIPLKGKDVCGLHVPWNLQVIKAKDNLSKSNKLI